MSPAGTIHFHFADTQFRLRHRHATRAWLTALAQHHGHAIGEMTYLFCSDGYMLDANSRHLDHHYYTDILTFPNPSALGASADILISIDRVRDNAKRLGQTPIDELHRVMAHGLLHLIGFDDTTPPQRQQMRTAEDDALRMRTFP